MISGDQFDQFPPFTERIVGGTGGGGKEVARSRLTDCCLNMEY